MNTQIVDFKHVIVLNVQCTLTLSMVVFDGMISASVETHMDKTDA